MTKLYGNQESSASEDQSRKPDVEHIIFSLKSNK